MDDQEEIGAENTPLEPEEEKTEPPSATSEASDGKPEEEADPKGGENVDVRTGDVGAGGTVIGKVVVGARTDLRFFEFPQKDIDLRCGVFSPSNSFKSAQSSTDRLNAPRVAVVRGPERSGKLTCAVNWGIWSASSAPGTRGCYNYLPSDEDDVLLLEAVKHDRWPSGSVVILEDAFDRNVGVDELEEPKLSQLSEELVAKESFLILTTEFTASRMTDVTAQMIDASCVDLKEVLENHLRYFQQTDRGGLNEELAIQVAAQWERLKPLLTRPYLVEKLCRALLRDNRPEAKLLEIAQEACQVNPEQLRSWFEKLSTNEKLFGLLAYLFEGIERKSFVTIYQRAIDILRAEAFPWARDIRTIGLFDLSERVQLQQESTVLRFEDDLVRQELGRQCGNRQLLLWCLLRPWAEEVSRAGVWITDTLRGPLGVAIGRLGVHDYESLLAVLTTLARSRATAPERLRDSVGALPGYSFATVVTLDPRGGGRAISAALKDWIRPTAGELNWAAGSASWRVYRAAFKLGRQSEEWKDRLLGDIRSRLETLLSRSEDQDLARCVAYALKEIGRDDRKSSVQLIVNWLMRDGLLQAAAKRAIAPSFESLRGDRFAPRLESNVAILKLVGPALSPAGPHPASIATMMNSLRQWLRWPEWREAISAELLFIANCGDSDTRQNLQSALARTWLASTDPETIFLAQALIGRCQAMNGVVIDHPDLGSAVLSVDPDFFPESLSKEATDRQREARDARVEARRGSARQLAALLRVQLDLTVTKLGDKAAQSPKAGPAPPDLESPTPVHRLLMPCLTTLDQRDFRLLVVLIAGPVADLEDVLGSGWSKKMLVISAGAKVSITEGANVIRVGRNLDSSDLRKIQEHFEKQWARAVATASPAAWRPLLWRCGYPLTDPASLERQLEVEVEALGEITSATCSVDRARSALAAILLLAATRLEAAITLLRRWLRSDGDETEAAPLRRAMAAAGARTLLRIHSSISPVPRRRTVKRLFRGLAEPLSRWHPDGVGALLAAIEHWLDDPRLAAFFAGGVVNGRCRLLRWAETHVPGRAKGFESVLDRLGLAQRKLGEDVGSVATALIGAFNQLKYTTVVGQPLEVPPLEEGQRYGVVLVDSQQAGSPLTKLGVTLVETLFRSTTSGLKPILFRLGESAPAWVPDADLPGGVRVHPGSVAFPPLLGALLNRHLTPESVAFVLVLSESSLLDGEDWIGSAWHDRIYCYRNSGGKDRARPWFEIPEFGRKREERLIAAYLAERSGFRLDSSTSPEPEASLVSDAGLASS